VDHDDSVDGGPGWRKRKGSAEKKKGGGGPGWGGVRVVGLRESRSGYNLDASTRERGFRKKGGVKESL